jgi:hypothetical protein
MSFQTIVGKIGEFISLGVQKSIAFFGKLGVNISLFQSKIIGLIILLLGAFLLIKFLGDGVKPMVKWSIIGLLIVLAISIGFSFFVT